MNIEEYLKSLNSIDAHVAAINTITFLTSNNLINAPNTVTFIVNNINDSAGELLTDMEKYFNE